MKIFRVVYYIFLGFIILIAVLLIVSVFPITGNIKFLTVQSGSMAPKIKMGSLAMIKPAHSAGSGQADYKIDDIITFGPYSKTKAPTTHRIYDIKVVNGELRYITKGDANNAPDQREISERDILGKVLFSVPYLGFAVDFAKKPIGFALIIIVPAAIIIYDEIKKIINEVKKKKKIV